MVGVALAAGCRECGSPLRTLAPARLAVDVTSLEFSATFVGDSSKRTVHVSNGGQVSAALDVATDAPFASTPGTLSVAGGATENVSVEFSPTAPGAAAGTLTLGALLVELRGEGLAVPECRADNPCAQSAFDLSASACVETPLPEGAPCGGACFLAAQCQAGLCVGQAKSCDDGNACTTDGCGDDGCSHWPVTCPQPASPCRVPTCDATTGCHDEVGPDGTLCGPDLCTATTADVCINGSCVQRTRPASGRCVNTWMSAYLLDSSGFALAYDSARKRVVLFGGVDPRGQLSSETWEWDGTAWAQRTPATSPPARTYHAMAYDAARQRVVLVGGLGGSGPTSDIWEWDGTTWVKRSAATQPPRRFSHAMAYDAARQRTILFGGLDLLSTVLSDTWEWDGTAWALCAPPAVPHGRYGHGMAYDTARERVVLFGGSDDPALVSAFDDTWEWDGKTWIQRLPQSSPPGGAASLAYDAARHFVVLFGRETPQSLVAGVTWEWDGTAWLKPAPLDSPTGRYDHALAYDAARQRVVLHGGTDASLEPLYDTWEWDGAAWLQRIALPVPAIRWGQAVTYDASRHRVVLFGGSMGLTRFSDTWEWDGTTWTSKSPAVAPPGRSDHALAFDDARQRVVLFGGTSGSGLLTDTWEWDGTTWTDLTPGISPPGWETTALAYDAAHQRVVLFGGIGRNSSPASETWVWDGTTWARQTPATSPPARTDHAMAYDAARQRVLLFGGWGGGGILRDTWEWDGTTWMPQTPATSPPGTHLHAMTFDTSRQLVLLYGGEGPGQSSAQTWDWDGATWTQETTGLSPPAGSATSSLTYDADHQRAVFYSGYGVWQLLP